MSRKIIFSILLINFFALTFEFRNTSYNSGNLNSDQLLNSFIDNASLTPIETAGIKIPLLKVTFYLAGNDDSVSKSNLISKSLQLTSNTESELNNRYSTFMIMESSTGT